MGLIANQNYTRGDIIASIIEAHPSETYEEYVRYKVEWYKSVFGEAKYDVDSNNYPCIILPWVNGFYDGAFDLCIRFDQTADALLSKNYTTSGTYIKFGLYEQATKKFTGRSPAQYFSGGRIWPTLIRSTYNAYYKVNTYGLDQKVISLGEFSNQTVNPASIPMNCMVAEFKRLSDDSAVNVVLFLPDLAVYQTTKYDSYPIELYYELDGVIKTTKIYTWGLTQSPTCVSMYQLNDGYIYSDWMYCCFPHDQSILQPLTIFAYDDTVNGDTWNKKCVTVGGKQFSIKCAMDNKRNNGNQNITLALLED